jgi:LysM repeat protein
MRILVLICFLIVTNLSFAQPGSKKITRGEYIEMYKNDAIKEMHRSGVPASITLAQGILESGDGNSALARYAKNHFGIKCHTGWTGKTFIQDDDTKDECFRKYKNVLDSYKDHSDFLQKKRYAFLFDLKPTDYKGWANGLKKAGYATNPKYPKLLISIIEQNNLAQYDSKKTKKSSTKKEKIKKSKSEKKTPVVKSKRKGSHVVKIHENNIRYIEVKPTDSFEKLADEFEMGLWQLYKYNDWDKERELFESGILFLQPKRGKAKEDLHIVATGETMWDISQKHGIKLEKLYKKNHMSSTEEPSVGDKVYLRSKKPL